MEMGFPHFLQAPTQPTLTALEPETDEESGLAEWGAAVIDAYVKRYRCYDDVRSTGQAIKWTVLQQTVPEGAVPALEHGYIVLPAVPTRSQDPYAQACLAHVVRQLPLAADGEHAAVGHAAIGHAAVGHFVRPVLSRTWAKSSENGGHFIDLGVKLPCGLTLHTYLAESKSEPKQKSFWSIFLDHRVLASWDLLRSVERALNEIGVDDTEVELDGMGLRMVKHPYGGATGTFS